MFAVIDSGTTNSRIYLVDEDGTVRASASKMVGVRDTSITGSRDALRNGLKALFYDSLKQMHFPPDAVRFCIASGMITSEIGLIDLPHLVAPAGLEELSAGIYRSTDPAVLPVPCPVYFIRGIRNAYPVDAGIRELCEIDFMRGEEVQCIGILERLRPKLPCTIVVLSSHTKMICCDANGRITASKTTLSGQIREALTSATMIGKSLKDGPEDRTHGYSKEEIMETAYSCVEREGVIRVFLMPRFMQVLMKTDAEERQLFTDSAIAADDMKAFRAMRENGCLAAPIILFGHAARCDIYRYLLRNKLQIDGEIVCISDQDTIGHLTVDGAIAVAKKIIERENARCSE